MIVIIYSFDSFGVRVCVCVRRAASSIDVVPDSFDSFGVCVCVCLEPKNMLAPRFMYPTMFCLIE